jgi:Tol biopolymer transport system component
VPALAVLLASGCERAELLGTMGEGEPSLIPDQPRPVTTVNDPEARDTDPSFTEDLKELYFMSDRSGDKRIWRSLRASADEPWGEPESVAELNTAGENENPFVSNDGLTIWFFTDRDRTISSQWRATRASRDAAWSAPEPVAELVLGEGSSDVSVAVDPSQTLFILNSKPTGAPPYRLYRLERATAADPLGEPVLMDDVVSNENEYDPDLRRDGLFLAFDSARGDPTQIYWTRRADRAAAFDAPVPVPALKSTFNDNAAAFSEDLRYVMFSSSRGESIDIYEALLSTPLF